MTALLLAAALYAPDNSLSEAERRAGWELLFDGATTSGWHNFRAKGVRPGWEVQDGALVSADPGRAGDIVTDKEYDWFELVLDFRLTPGGNSGVMFHVQSSGEKTWHSGPEVQIYESKDPGAQVTGWLYELYGSPVDATRPVGEWNTMRILVTPKHCQTDVNGVKYYEYVLGSDDFKARVAKSKFSEWPAFARRHKGALALQGDHGVVAFKNIKVRRVKG